MFAHIHMRPVRLLDPSQYLHQRLSLHLTQSPHAGRDLVMCHAGQHLGRALQETHDRIIGHTQLVCRLDYLEWGNGNMEVCV